MVIPLLVHFPTASYEGPTTSVFCHCLCKSDPTAELPLLIEDQLNEVIEFGDSYEVPQEASGTGSASEGHAKKKGRTVTVTTEDMQKRRNDVKARTTLLLALPDEHQLRFSNGKGEVNTGSIPTASTQVFPASADVAAASFGHDTKKTRKKITIQRTDVASFDMSKVECFNCHKMGHFTRECRAPSSQDRVRRENFKQGSKVEELAPKALMAIDGVGWDWSNMANEEENHALVADEEAPTEFALMAKSSSSFENEVEARLVEFKNQEIKFCEKIRGLEFNVESKNNRIETLTNELEELKKEKEGLDSKLTGFQSASKDLDTLLGSQRCDKNKEGLGYSVVPPSYSSLLSSQERYVLDRIA
nr:hypothetical protein [Tanacetum cinerariifolium]